MKAIQAGSLRAPERPPKLNLPQSNPGGHRPGLDRALRLTRRLPVDSQRELDNSWIVGLAVQPLQSCHVIGSHVIRMVEKVEEVCREPCFDRFSNLEVLEERKIYIPGAWSDNETSRTWIEEIGANRGITNRPIS